MGGWRPVKAEYLRPNTTRCALCGQLLVGRAWRGTDARDVLSFCGPDHEARYVAYWIPRYGEAVQASARGE